jgi:hypothetical protein
MTTFGSILPPLLLLFEAPAPIAWRISSGVMAVILGSWALTFPHRRRAVNPTRLPLQVVTYSLAMGVAALTLAANAIVVPGERLAGVYAAAVTAILIGAGMLFLFAFVHWYDALIDHEQPK